MELLKKMPVVALAMTNIQATDIITIEAINDEENKGHGKRVQDLTLTS
jgi:hypothetical protein